MKIYKVYLLESLKCDKKYIGMTSQILSHRYNAHKVNFNKKVDYKIYNIIRELELTMEDFIITLLKDFNDKKDALLFEKKQILKNGGLNSRYIDKEWNLGTTHIVSEDTKLKISNANKGQIPYSKGKKQPKEHTDKIIKSLTGRNLSIAHCDAISKSQKGLSRDFKVVECPHCGKEAKENVVYRWHFDNCKHKVA